MTDNPYAGLWNVSLNVIDIMRETQNQIDAALFEFAKGIEISFSTEGEDIKISPYQSAPFAEGDIEEAQSKTIADILREYFIGYRSFYKPEDGPEKRYLKRSEVEPILRKIESTIAEVRSICVD